LSGSSSLTTCRSGCLEQEGCPEQRGQSARSGVAPRRMGSIYRRIISAPNHIGDAQNHSKLTAQGSAKMHFTEAFRIALHCMRTGRLRTALTMLGIVLSVSLVIVLSALNNGLNNTYQGASMCSTRLITVCVAAALQEKFAETSHGRRCGGTQEGQRASVIAGVVQDPGASRDAKSLDVCSANVIGHHLTICGSVANRSRSAPCSPKGSTTATLGWCARSLCRNLFGGNARDAVGSKILIGRRSSMSSYACSVRNCDNAALIPMPAGDHTCTARATLDQRDRHRAI